LTHLNTPARINEEALFNIQLEFLNKLDKKYEAMSLNTEDNAELYAHIKKALKKNAERRNQLINDAKPKLL
jgi:hypothetical protein